MVEMKDQFGDVTYYDYDCRDRLRNGTDPDGDMRQYSYDATNDLLEIANVRSDDMVSHRSHTNTTPRAVERV